MKNFLYGFCNIMGTRLELPYLGASGQYALGGVAAVCIFTGVCLFALFSVVQLVVDLMLGKFAM